MSLNDISISDFKNMSSKNVFMLLPSIFMVIIIILLFVALNYNVTIASQLDYAKKYGERQQSECGNEYLEAQRLNYQIYDYIAGPDSSTIINNIIKSFQIIQSAWMLVVTLVFGLMIYDNIKLYLNQGLSYSSFKALSAVLAVGLIGFYWLYLSYLFIIPVKQIISNINSAQFTVNTNNTSDVQNKMYIATACLLSILVYFGILIHFNPNAGFEIKPLYFTLTVLLILIGILSSQFTSTFINVISNVYTNYVAITDDIQTQIVKIFNNAPILSASSPSSNLNSLAGNNSIQVTQLSMPQNPPQTYLDQFKFYLLQNIKQIENTDGDNFILTDYQKKFWPYLIHQNGNELAEVYKYNLSNINTYIVKIRDDMRNLRNNTNIGDSVDKITKSTYNLTIIVLSIIMFGIFHLIYKHLNKPVSATSLITLFVLIFAISGPIYGWIQNIINKTY
jgi:hypothetical protein